MIDLRSDTVTKPSPKMLEAMLNANVGDDVYSEDPTVNKLQEITADYFGMEAALFTPSGTMANQIGLQLNTERGDEIIAEADAHIYYYETAGPAVLSNLQIRPIPSEDGKMPIKEIEKAIRPDIYYFPKTSLIALENTHNRHGGKAVPLEYMQEVKSFANSKNLRTHLDGARLWNAIIKENIDPKDIGKCFNTISVCYSKGLGAPVGSCLVGSKDDIKKALKIRKIFGGGMRQAGLLAAAAIFSLENNLELLQYDHENAKNFANSISRSKQIKIDPDSVDTNIVTFELDSSINADEFVTECKDAGILLMNIGDNKIRTVFHIDISSVMASSASELILNLTK